MLGFHRPRSLSEFTEDHCIRARRKSSDAGEAIRGLLLKGILEMRDEAVQEFERAKPELGVTFFDDQFSLLSGNAKAVTDLGLGPKTGNRLTSGNVMQEITQAAFRLRSSRQLDASLVICLGDDSNDVATLSLRVSPNGDVVYSAYTHSRSVGAALKRRCAELGFTRCEAELVTLLSGGLSNIEIADKLNISRRAVENHLRSIFAKAGVKRRTRLINRILN